MEHAYNQSFKESFSLDEEKEKKKKYKECLYRELSFEKLKSGGTESSIQQYLESNLTEERIVQIQFFWMMIRVVMSRMFIMPLLK